MKKSILSLAVVALLFSSCNKNDDDEKNLAISKENIAGNYKITSIKLNGTEVYTEYTEPCQRDDVFNFKTDFTYSYTDAGTQCDPNGSFTDGEWNLSGTNSLEYFGEVYTIDKLTNAIMQVSISEGGLTSVIIFSRQ